MTRTIKLKVLNSTEVVTIESDVRTFGELKSLKEVKDLGIDWTSAKLIDRATKTSFEVDSAILPAINCIMFHTPTKSKAGIDWSEASYKDCKSQIKLLKDSGVVIPFNYTNASATTLQNFLVDYYVEADVVEDNSVVELIDTISGLLEELRGKVQDFTIMGEEIDVVEMITIEDLDAEFAEIQASLKR